MRLMIALVSLTLLLAGCSDDPADDTEDPDDQMEGPDDGDGMAGDVRQPITWPIDIQGNDFIDGSLTIQVGDTVEWTTADNVPHTVTADDGAFDSGPCPGSACLTQANPTYSYTFDEVGEFAYHCEIHPSMTDTITVAAFGDDTA